MANDMLTVFTEVVAVVVRLHVLATSGIELTIVVTSQLGTL